MSIAKIKSQIAAVERRMDVAEKVLSDSHKVRERLVTEAAELLTPVRKDDLIRTTNEIGKHTYWRVLFNPYATFRKGETPMVFATCRRCTKEGKFRSFGHTRIDLSNVSVCYAK